MERIQAIRLFVRVVDLGSFSKAAAELGLRVTERDDGLLTRNDNPAADRDMSLRLYNRIPAALRKAGPPAAELEAALRRERMAEVIKSNTVGGIPNLAALLPYEGVLEWAGLDYGVSVESVAMALTWPV